MKLTLPWGVFGQIAFIAVQVYLMTHFARNVFTTGDIDAIRSGLLVMQGTFAVTQHLSNPITGQIGETTKPSEPSHP